MFNHEDLYINISQITHLTLLSHMRNVKGLFTCDVSKEPGRSEVLKFNADKGKEDLGK